MASYTHTHSNPAVPMSTLTKACRYLFIWRTAGGYFIIISGGGPDYLQEFWKLEGQSITIHFDDFGAKSFYTLSKLYNLYTF